jgi:hypothetical protein
MTADYADGADARKKILGISVTRLQRLWRSHCGQVSVIRG